MFKLNTMKNLVIFLMENYPDLVYSMKQCEHSTPGTIHPFHGEGSVWTHTMMVMQYIENDSSLDDLPYSKQVLLTSALLHDIGKPSSRIHDDIKNKFIFKGHEGLSYFKSIGILKSMEKVDDFYSNLNYFRKNIILKLVALHGTGILNEESVFGKLQVRFRIADKEGAIRNVDENLMARYPVSKVSDRSKVQDNKKIVLLVGLPTTGKIEILLKQKYKDYYIINEVDVSAVYFNIQQYDNILVVMNRLSFSSRRSILNSFPKHQAECELVYCSEELSNSRNTRFEETYIPKDKLHKMKQSFLHPHESEGFYKIYESEL